MDGAVPCRSAAATVDQAEPLSDSCRVMACVPSVIVPDRTISIAERDASLFSWRSTVVPLVEPLVRSAVARLILARAML